MDSRLAYGGLRWGEVAALRRKSCHLLRARIEVRESLSDLSGRLYFGPTKTYAARRVVIPSFLRTLLAQHLADHVASDPDALVFTAPNGGPLRNSTWHDRFWTPAVHAAKLPAGLRIHDLRHTCAALLISRGAHVKAVQRHLGHSSATVTLNTYSHLFPEDMEQIVDGLEAAHNKALTACGRPEADDRVSKLKGQGTEHAV